MEVPKKGIDRPFAVAICAGLLIVGIVGGGFLPLFKCPWCESAPGAEGPFCSGEGGMVSLWERRRIARGMAELDEQYRERHKTN